MLPYTKIEGIQVPRFEEITAEGWDGALAQAWSEAELDGELIKNNPQAPSFENTFKAMERRQQRLARTLSPFVCTQAADNPPHMQALAEKWLPRFDELSVRFMDDRLAQRCKQALETEPGLDDVDRRLAEETLRQFHRNGAFLQGQERDRFRAIRKRLSELGLAFASAHQSNTGQVVLVPADLPGVDEVYVQNAKAASPEPGKAAIGMNASEVETLLAQCSDRATRETVWKAFANRGTGQREGDTSTRETLAEMLALRHEMAALLGHATWADYATEARMAGNSAAAMDMVRNTWEQLAPVLENDLHRLAEYAREHGQESQLEPWDVDYWLGRVRQADFAVDEEQVRQHLALPLVRAGAFAVAESLFGVSFEPAQAPTYHPDATAFMVRDRDTRPLGLLYIDDAIRPTKSSGAFMDQLMVPDRLDGHHLPVVVNVCNFPSATQDRPALLSMDEAVTAFHELGHALHSLMTTARYPTQSGPMVYGDFVELQSQLLENWIREPEALARIARHWETGEPMSLDMAQQVQRAMQFGGSVEKARYLISAWVDLAAHASPSNAGRDPLGFEATTIEHMGGHPAITPRHRLTHFTHLFSGAMGGEYSAGYYAYLWAEVLEADAFEAFRESGEMFEESLGQKLRDTLYARGNEVEPSELYRQFRGRDPDPAALLRRMGAQVKEPARNLRM